MDKPFFINIDLELSSQEDLTPIENELGQRISVLMNQKIGTEFKLNFESMDDHIEGGALNKLSNLLSLIDGLSIESKGLVSRCNKRVLDIGYNSGSLGWLYTSLPNSIIRKIAELDFDLNFSLYGVDSAQA